MSRLYANGIASRTRAAVLSLPVLASMLVSPCNLHAQAASDPTGPQASAALAPVPTTKLLAIGSFTAGTTPASWRPILPAEARETVRLYLAGKIDQWFVKQDQSGVVFLMNVTDPTEARALLEQLPFGPAGLMTFQLIPLGPISPLRLLLEPSK